MKTIKVFIASSEELRMERLEFTDMIQQLNRILKPRGVEIEPVKWEYLDASMGPLHKQEEYNNELKTCEICLALYWTKFGEYTKSELDTAYEELKAGRNPQKLYVYFKDTDDITPELKEFKDSFATRYGHFFCRFENVDTMRLNFLLQFEEYQNQRNESLLKVRDSKVEIDGKPLVDLRSVPFCGNNPEYQQVLKDIEKAQARVLKYPDEIEFRQELHDLKERCEKMEQNLLDTAKLITKLSYTASSARLTEAIRLFGQGDNRGANAVLNLAEIGRDAEANIARIDAARELEAEARKALETNIEEYQLKIKTLSSEMAEGWVGEVISVYAKAAELARGHISQEKFAELLLNYADFLSANKQYHLVGNLYNECLDIYRHLADTNPDSFLSYLATTLNSLGALHYDIQHYQEAEQEYQEARNIFLQLAENHPEVLSHAAMMLNNSGNVHSAIQHYQEAEQEYQEALKIYQQLADKNPDAFLPYVATALNNLGALNYNIQHYQEAEPKYQEALKIRRQLAEKNPDAFLPYVATTLNNLGALHYAIQHYREAEQEYQEALRIRRQLAEKNPDAFLPSIADTLNNLGALHDDIQNHKEAEQEYREALKIYRQLAEKNPDAFLSGAARTLKNLGILYWVTKQYAKTRDCWSEALDIYRNLSDYNNIELIQSWLNEIKEM